eukprot:1302817-Amphidinium_carterae.3
MSVAIERQMPRHLQAPTSPGSEVKAALDELKKEIGILEKIVKVPATLPKEGPLIERAWLAHTCGGDDFEDPLEGEEEACDCYPCPKQVSTPGNSWLKGSCFPTCLNERGYLHSILLVRAVLQPAPTG